MFSEHEMKDNINSSNEQMEKLRPLLVLWDRASSAERNGLSNRIEMHFQSLDLFISQVKCGIESIHNESLERTYKEQYMKLKDQRNKLFEEWISKKNKHVDLNTKDIYIEMKDKPISEMNVQEAFNKGDHYVKESGHIIKNVNVMIDECVDHGTKIEQELHRQNEQLGNIQGDLSEIDESLKRSNKTMRQILVGLATDKFILFMIVIIILIIIVIIIVSATGDPNNSVINSLNDVFGVRAKNTTQTSTTKA